MKKKLKELKWKIDSLTVFSHIKNDDVLQKLHALLDAVDKYVPDSETNHAISLYSDFVSALYEESADLTDYIHTLLLQDDNFYVKETAAGRSVPEAIRQSAQQELLLLAEIAALTPADVREVLDYKGFLPEWTVHEADFQAEFEEKLKNITKTGYGIFAKYNFFRLDNGEIVPVAHPDHQTLDQLFGYERERNLILKNTQALTNGESASNMLLYGDAGTGKSSTVKAVAAALAPQGLRLIEVKKNQLYQIPQLMEELASNPLKFILFIDDLSFNGSDDNFSALKATLEGSISGCGDNVAIYATSNRRHLVKETFSERTGDELHVNDTLQETMSLSARFGLTITFQKPDKDEYLAIVKSLAAEYGVDMDEAELFRRAEAYAIRKSGRSPRTAKQFIELLKIGI